MKIAGVDFNFDWVAKFESAEAFAQSPSNAHLFPELKTQEKKAEQLAAVWRHVTGKNLTNALDTQPLAVRDGQSEPDGDIQADDNSSAARSAGSEPKPTAQGRKKR